MSDSVPLRRDACAEEGCGLLTDTDRPISCNTLIGDTPWLSAAFQVQPVAGSLHWRPWSLSSGQGELVLELVRTRNKVFLSLIVNLLRPSLLGKAVYDCEGIHIGNCWSLVTKTPAVESCLYDGEYWCYLRVFRGSRYIGSSYLVDPASSHMLVSKIKPCMSKYKQVCTVKLRMAH